MRHSIFSVTALLLLAAPSSGDSPVACDPVDQAFRTSTLPLAVLASSGPGVETSFRVFSRTQEIGPDSIFDIASMTKAITSTAVMQLVEAGRIDLDAPVSTYLPHLDELEILNEDLSTRPATVPITMRHLLTHTAGFGYFFNSPRIARDLGREPGQEGWPPPEVIPADDHDWGFGGLQPRRVFEAGETWHYGRNLGIAGRVVEAVSGMDLDTYFKTRIFDPLNMNRSGYNLPPDLAAQRIPLMVREPSTGVFLPLPPTRTERVERFYGGGGLLSTPRDYLRFLTCLARGGELDGHRILSEASVEEFFTNQLPPGMTINHRNSEQTRRGADDPARCFMDDSDLHSLAWAIEANPRERGQRTPGVAYWSGIFNTYYTIDRARGVVVVAFMQLLPFNDAEAYELYRTYEDCRLASP